ncbi:ribonuclease H-like domain-containing protein [Tanacetum coccineum]
MSANDDFSLHDDEELSLHDDASLAGSVPASNKGDAPAKPPQIITTNTLSNIKLPVLQKDDYDTWAMEMEHYLEYIDNEVWKVIQNGNSKKRVTKGKDGVYRVLPPTTQAEQVADEKERKARTLLLMAVPKDHLRRFHGMDDAKEIWAAIKTRFGGNANSKKMQKAVLKQQFEAFTISSKESLEKGYDRFQKLLSQLDALGASVSDEDANHKFLRSLPPAWDSLAMTMRTKKNIDTLSIDDLYNNLSVFEQDIQKTSSSSLTSDNVAFLSQAKASSSKHKPSHNSGSYSSYTTSSSKATPTATPGLADEVIHSFLATNADDVDLIHEDLDQIDDLDLEEMDINWQIAMTAIKIKKFYKKTGRRPRVDGKMHVAFDKRKVECFNCHNTGHFARECKFKGTKDGSRQEASRGQDFKPVRTEKEALMTIDEGQINWVEQTTDEEINHALMAFTVNNEVSMCSKLCLDSYNALKAKYDELQSEFGDQEAALTAHKIGLKKVEAQLRASHKQQISLNEKLHFQANQIFEKDEKLKKYRRIGMKAVKDKDALQKIVDSWFASSKNLWKLIDCGMSSTVKLGLGYSIKSNAEVLSYEEEMDRGIFASIRETDPGYHDIPLYSRFKQVEYKGVPHPLSGDYTPREQEDIDDSLYEYGKFRPQPQSSSPTVSNASSIVFSICPSNDRNEELGAVSDASSTHYSTCQSNDSDGELGTVTENSVNDDLVNDQTPIPTIEQVTIVTQKTQPQVPKPTQTVDPSCAQHVKPPRQQIKTPVTSSSIPSNHRHNWNQRMQRDLGAGYSFERKPCFVCGSLSHLIKDCDYYEKKMAREAALKSKRVVHTDVRQATPAWNNTNRVNKANQFNPRPVNVRPNLSTASNTIKTGRLNVNTGHGNVNSGSVHVNAGKQVKSGASRFNTGKQHVNSGSVRVNSVTQVKSGTSRFNTGKHTVNSARVLRPVSNNTSPKISQVNFNNQNKCFSKQSSPVNRPFSRKTAHESNKYAVKGKMGTAVKTSAGCVWRKVIPLSNINSGPTPDSNVSRGPQGRLKPVKAWDHPLKHYGSIEIIKNSLKWDLLLLEEVKEVSVVKMLMKIRASKTSKELQELADLEEAKRVQAEMDVETQRQIDLDALLARRLVEQEEEAARHNCCPKEHAELKSKSFEEIQVLYERYKKQDQTFVAIGSEEDERAIKKMNEKDADKEEEKKDESVHEEVQEEEGAKKRKLGTRRKLKAKRRKHASSLTREDDDLKICLHIAPDEDKVIDAESLDHQYPIIEWQSFFLTTKPQYDQTKPDEDIYLNKVTRSNGHQRFFRTLMGVLSILDREDLKVIYELVMEEYKDKLPEGFDKMLWGDLMIMFNQGDTADFWDTQQNWKLISWKLHSSSGVHTIMTSTGLVIHMFVENRYPLAKEVLSNMLELKLETEEESSMALELIKFVKQQLEEFEDSNDDDSVTSDHEEAERGKSAWDFRGSSSSILASGEAWDTADFWDTQQDWKLISWKLHSSSGVHTIMTSTGLVFHMLVESKYPLTKEVLSQMLELKLETEEESSMALELIKFVRHQLEEFEDSNDDDTVTSTHEDEERFHVQRFDMVINPPWNLPFLGAKGLTSPEQTATAVMSSDSAVTYTSVHSEARSWSIPSEDPYEEAARQLLEQAPNHSTTIPSYHTTIMTTHTLEQSWLRGELLKSILFTTPARTPPLLPIPLLTPSTSHRADIPKADMPPAAAARPARGLRADYGFVATMDREIRRDLERDVGYRITESWDEIVEAMQGIPIVTDMAEFSQRMTEFETRVRRGRRAHVRTARLMEAEARMSREAWGRSMDASSRPHEAGGDYRDVGGRSQEAEAVHRGTEAVEETSDLDDRVRETRRTHQRSCTARCTRGGW